MSTRYDSYRTIRYPTARHMKQNDTVQEKAATGVLMNRREGNQRGNGMTGSSAGLVKLTQDTGQCVAERFVSNC